MLCKVSPSQSAKPLVFRQVGNHVPAREGQGAGQSGGSEIGELKQRIAELERLRQSEVTQARQAALEQGSKTARDQCAAEVQVATERLAKTLADLAAYKKKLRADAEMDLVNLSLAIARRILYRELTTDSEAVHGLVHAALQKIQKREVLRIRINPAGAEAVQSCIKRLGLEELEVVGDKSLKTGDLLIDTTTGELDASVDTQLQEIQRGFADRLSIR
jgi:flagellar assembly protein FliH